MQNNKPWAGRIDGADPAHLRFHQCVTTYTAAQPPGKVLLGFACDEGVRRNQGRIGASEAPDTIRQQLANIAIHTPFNLYDAGNIACTDQNLEHAQQQLADKTAELLRQGHFPIILGGGHEAAFGSFLGLYQSLQSQTVMPRIGVINFDAHFDLREQKQATSGTPFWQIAQHLHAHQQDFHYLCLGICSKSNTQALFECASALKVDYILDNQLTIEKMSGNIATIDHFIEKVDIICLSIDLDVFSYSMAPGVSAPAVLGVSLEVIERLLQHIFLSKKVRLADIAECNPHYDIQNHTARLAAYLTMELIDNSIQFS